ncbi:MAG: phosphoglycerate kinase [Candidatus Aenigmatarchaeota archaeon]
MEIDLPSVRDVDLQGKTVLMRVDYNLPLDEKGNVTDHTRISATMRTLNHILNENAKLVLISHLGRPKNRENHLRMDVVAKELSNLLGIEVKKLDECIGNEVEKAVKEMKEGDIILLENIRFYPEETDKDAKKREEFARKIASLGDIYVNEAFAASHRDHASITGIPKFIPGCAGLSFLREVRMIDSIVKNPERPYAAIIGGAKDDKILAIENLLPKVDVMLMGGVIGNTFLKAKGFDIGDSKYEEAFLPKAKEILENANDKILLPDDVIVEINGEIDQLPVSEVRNGMKIMDIGPETIVNYKNALRKAKTIIWAGPLGMFEKKPFEKGTLYIASFISGLEAKTLVGGGDSISAMQMLNMAERMTHISTGGGAFVDYITKDRFPGLEALKDSLRMHGHKLKIIEKR